jgi:hypothetical protein
LGRQSDLSFGYLSAELKSPVKIPIPVGAPAESIDLGRLELCIHADPLEPTTEFYARLGFRFVSSPDPRTMRPQVGHIAAEFERLANVLLGRGCGNAA